MTLGLGKAYEVCSNLVQLFSSFVGQTFIAVVGGFISIRVFLKMIHNEV